MYIKIIHIKKSLKITNALHEMIALHKEYFSRIKNWNENENK
jgi:hypothetical protein